ncbi:MAG: hypothetical protein KI792_12400 [Alphaproteobacteria bacterium]|nr:hypothetical protein [Alphaproteobacteria bacterium SS10]
MTPVKTRRLSVLVATLASAPLLVAHAQAPSVPLNSPPSLDLNRMIQSLESEQSAAESEAAPAPAPVAAPSLPATLEPIAPQAPAPAAPELPAQLGDFEAPPPPPPVEPGERQLIGPGIAVGPNGLPSPEMLLGLAGEGELPSDLEFLARLFGEDLGFATSSPTLLAQSMAVTFVDYLYRSDRPRLRAMVGAPFYADEFPLENIDELNRIFGEPAPISGPPNEVIPERVDDRLVGISTMRISELRTSEFYIGDRGADLIGLEEDDFFVHIVFERNGFFAPMIVYVRQLEEGFEIAGFYD